MKHLNTIRAAVMIFIVGIGLSAGAEDIVVTKEMKAAVKLQEAATQDDIDTFKAMGIFCTLKKRGLQNDPRYSAFYDNYAEEFKNVTCGDWDKK